MDNKTENLKNLICDLEKEEFEIINKSANKNNLYSKTKNTIFNKVPDKVISTLEIAFEKAFDTVFTHGSEYIEKTYNETCSNVEFMYNDILLNEDISKKNIKNFNKTFNRENFKTSAFTTISGASLGFLGMGLPDIPLLLTTILRGIYKTTLGYGISHDNENEKIYILKLIKVSLLENEEKKKAFEELNNYEQIMNYGINELDIDINNEIRETSKIMANALLVEKFVQGFPVVGVVGGLVNFSIYKKISKLANIRYQKRYLKNSL